MKRAKLLRLDHPTDTTGRVYTEASVREWLKEKGPDHIVYGELGQPSTEPFSRCVSIDSTRICVGLDDFNIIDGYLVGRYRPFPPLGMTIDLDNVSFRFRGITYETMDDENETVLEVREIVAFDVVENPHPQLEILDNESH